MANKTSKKAVSYRSKVTPAALKGVTGRCAVSLAKIAEEGRKVHVLGRVRNGKVEFDQSTLQAFARRFPKANMSFVAVNAPFDPVRHRN